MATTVFLGLGSNLGDRLENLRRAVELLGRGDIQVRRTSRVYETDPVGGPPQPPYLNAVAEVETSLTPRGLLEACLSVEDALGRVRRERWGPRTVDIDVLTYDEETVKEPGLEIPHPRMHERAFVLVPFLELTRDPFLGDGRRVGELRLASQGSIRVLAPPLLA